MTVSPGGAAHWDQAYELGDSARSWHEAQPTMSLRMLGLAGTRPSDSFIDIGGGASPLVGVLLERDFTDLTVLDIPQTGLDHARQRLNAGDHGVSWVCVAVLAWRPGRCVVGLA